MRPSVKTPSPCRGPRTSRPPIPQRVSVRRANDASNPKPPFPASAADDNVKKKFRRGASVEDYLREAFVAARTAGRRRHALLQRSRRQARATLNTCAHRRARLEGGPSPTRTLLRCRRRPLVSDYANYRLPAIGGQRGRARHRHARPPAGELAFPQGVALAPRELYVADGACRVQLLDHVRFVAEIGAGGALDHPCGVAVAADGRVFVSDQSSTRRRLRRRRRRSRCSFGKRGYAASCTTRAASRSRRRFGWPTRATTASPSSPPPTARTSSASARRATGRGSSATRRAWLRRPRLCVEYGGGRLQVLNTNGACVQLVVPPAAGAVLGARRATAASPSSTPTAASTSTPSATPTAPAPRRSATRRRRPPPRVADGATLTRGHTRARRRAMAAADWAGVLKELEPAHPLARRRVARTPRRPGRYADPGHVEVDRETGATPEGA